MCRVPDKIVRQNGTLIRFCELRTVNIAKVEQQDPDMVGRSESCWTG